MILSTVDMLGMGASENSTGASNDFANAERPSKAAPTSTVQYLGPSKIEWPTQDMDFPTWDDFN